MNYSTIIDTFVISEMNAKVKIEAKSKKSRALTINSPLSILTSSSSSLTNKVQCMSGQPSLLRTRLEHEPSDPTAKTKGTGGPSAAVLSSIPSSSKPVSHASRKQRQRPISSNASTHTNSGTTAAAGSRRNKDDLVDLGQSEIAHLEGHLAGIKIKQVKAFRRQTRSDLLDVVHQHGIGGSSSNGGRGAGQNSHRYRNSIGSLQDVAIEDLFEKRKSLRNSVMGTSGHGQGYQGHGQGWGRQHRRGSNDSLEMPCANNRRFSKMK